ncbi:MAG: hypothetical protein LQ338_001470 [Usnochroma carphineum]|nr:MAG: hypothetical protein LQ338_001470 [Usnochroma carphineum]
MGGTDIAEGQAGITHCFVNLGSDHPSIIEAMVKGQKERKDRFPRILTCPNEMVALSMADGYARLTGKPQCVIVHVDVGTQGLGAAVHNASCGRAPVLVFAGLSPYTCDGEYRGSRTEYIHWIQDVPDQKQIVSQYCRYSAEIKCGRNIKQMVGRALQFATSAPAGPAYLVGAREVMEEDIEPYELDQAYWGPVGAAALPEDAVQEMAEALVGAKEPLLITGYSGRHHDAVGHLVKLADTVKGLRVIDTGGSDMCFPANHRASLGLRYGIHEKIPTADVILVADCDVPWIPTQCRPSPGTRIFHLDSDPLKQQIPVFYFPAEARYKVSTAAALRQLNTYISSSPSLSQTLSESTFNVSYLVSRLKYHVPQDTIFAIEAVTLTAFVADQLAPTIPGTWLNCGGGGLGWSGGAALGIKLAVGDKRFVCQIVGDGTFLFSIPGSVYWISQRYNLPVFTIVLNNQGWNAPRRSLLLVHPDGEGSKVGNEEMNISFAPSPDYAGIAKCAAGGNLWAGTAGTADELEHKLQEAVASVKGGVGAVLDAHLDGPQGKYGGGRSVTVG